MKQATYCEAVHCVFDGFTATVTLDHPPVNVLNRQVLDGLGACFDALAGEPDLRCVIVTGTDRAFVAGGDIFEFQGIGPEDIEVLAQKANTIYRQIETLPCPVIAAINGYALGAGLELALCCDIRIAAEEAVMALPEVMVGMIPMYGGTARLAKLIGPSQAKYMIFSGERIRAQRAYDVGILQEVLPSEALLPRAKALAETFSSHAPIALRQVKSVIRHAQGTSIETALELESEGAKAVACSEDIHEGIAAFLEKRPAAFHNR